MTQKKIRIAGHEMLLTAEADRLTGCRWLPSGTAGSISKAQRSSSSAHDGENAILDEAVKEITEYLEGRRQTFDIAIRPTGTEFQIRVWEELRRVRYGQTITYAELARRTGRPKAYRAVANACGANPLPIILPCHRVVASGGGTGGYTGGLDIKLTLLGIEKQNRR